MLSSAPGSMPAAQLPPATKCSNWLPEAAPACWAGEDIGSLEVGKCADFFLVDSRRLELTGAEYSPADALATVGLRGPVDWTVVNGRVVVREGRLVSVDEERVAEEARPVASAYLSLSIGNNKEPLVSQWLLLILFHKFMEKFHQLPFLLRQVWRLTVMELSSPTSVSKDVPKASASFVATLNRGTCTFPSYLEMVPLLTPTCLANCSCDIPRASRKAFRRNPKSNASS